MERLRPTVPPAPGTVCNLLELYFPNTGTIGSSKNLGIAWANPNDHTQLLAAVNGIDLNGVTYFCTNWYDLVSSDALPSFSMNLYAVDASGNDLGVIGSTIFGINQQMGNFGAINFSLSGNYKTACGIRGQITIDTSLGGSAVTFIPSPMLFIGNGPVL